MNRYVHHFFQLKCCGDVMNTCFPVGNKTDKEITESMAIIKRLKKITIPNPMKYTLYDFCAGNALTSILACFLLPVKEAIAIDKRPRKRRYHLAKRFQYIFDDIYEFDPDKIVENSIIMGVHSCSNLANRIIEIYKQSKAEYLILMPCCHGKVTKVIPPAIRKIIKEKYILWTWQLAEECDGRFTFDKYCISPKNGVIVAKKESI